MTSKILFFIGVSILFPIAFGSCARADGKTDGEKATLCAVVKNPEIYEGRIVVMNVQAQAALHQFDVALISPACPNRNIFLRAGRQFLDDKIFMDFVRKLYPYFPEGDAYTDNLADIRVVGKIVRQENRGLLMTYLELQKISAQN